MALIKISIDKALADPGASLSIEISPAIGEPKMFSPPSGISTFVTRARPQWSTQVQSRMQEISFPLRR